ncbi:MAG: phosphoribosyltransferase family protein [Proteobacteria bacterium]|nr:phosphoribosyltransferase family protein [Pseudomonadota bacterium]
MVRSVRLKPLADLVPVDTEVLAGLELGGVPLCVALSIETGIPAAFVRKERKAYSTARLAEGADVRGRNVCVIEDIVSTGGQALDSIAQLREEGAKVSATCCVVLRRPESRQAFLAASVDLRFLLTGD